MIKRLTEESFLRQILLLARIKGWRSAHFRPARTAHGWRTPVSGDGKGFPDLVLVKGKKLLFVELKLDRGKTSPEQEQWLRSLAAAGVKVAVWRPRDWNIIVEALS